MEHDDKYAFGIFTDNSTCNIDASYPCLEKNESIEAMKEYANHVAAPLLEQLAAKDARIAELDSFVNKVRGIKIEANEFSKGEQLGDEPDPLGYRNAMADIRTSLCQLLFDLDGPLLIKEKSGG